MASSYIHLLLGRARRGRGYNLMGIKTEEINNGNGRRVLEDYSYQDGEIIPAGFEFDGASCPRIFWRIVPPFKNLECSARHDWDCAKARRQRSLGFEKEARAERKKADKRYKKCIGKHDNRLNGFIAWSGVRVGSWSGSGW